MKTHRAGEAGCARARFSRVFAFAFPRGPASFQRVSLLSIRDLRVVFPARPQAVVAVDGVSLEVAKGAAVGLVGESGSGKTTTGRCVIRLARPTSGEIYFDGERVDALSERAFFPFRRRVQMVFQDPRGSLHPRLTVGAIMAEPLRLHFPALKRTQRRERAARLLDQVGLSPAYLERQPHQLSGGQRQRVGIARALAVEPELLILDEPVSALDVSVQAQVLNLLRDLRTQTGVAMLFISHDLAVVEHGCDHVAVMERGRIVEAGTAAQIAADPTHPYTRQLWAAAPQL